MEIWEAMRFGVMVHKALQGDYSAIRKLAEENRSRARYGWPSVKDELKALADNPEAQDAMKEMAEEDPKIKEELKAMAEDQEDPTRIFDKIKKNIEKVESIEVDVTRRRVTKTMLEVFREMVEVEHVLADYGYTIIARNKIKNFAEFKNYFDKELADFIKESLGYNDKQFEEYLEELFDYRTHREADKLLTLSKWAEINKNEYEAEDPEAQNQLFANNENVVEKEESPEVTTARRDASGEMMLLSIKIGDVRRALWDYGYTIIARYKIKNFAEFKKYFDKELADFIKETLRYDDAQFDEFLLDICNFKLPNGDLSLSLADWSYINKMKYLDEKRNKIDEDKR